MDDLPTVDRRPGPVPYQRRELRVARGDPPGECCVVESVGVHVRDDGVVVVDILVRLRSVAAELGEDHRKGAEHASEVGRERLVFGSALGVVRVRAIDYAGALDAKGAGHELQIVAPVEAAYDAQVGRARGAHSVVELLVADVSAAAGQPLLLGDVDRLVVQLEKDGSEVGIGPGYILPESDRVLISHLGLPHGGVDPVQVEDDGHSLLDRIVNHRVDDLLVAAGGGAWRRGEPPCLVERDADGVGTPASHRRDVGCAQILPLDIPLERRARNPLQQNSGVPVVHDPVAVGAEHNALLRPGIHGRRRQGRVRERPLLRGPYHLLHRELIRVGLPLDRTELDSRQVVPLLARVVPVPGCRGAVAVQFDCSIVVLVLVDHVPGRPLFRGIVRRWNVSDALVGQVVRLPSRAVRRQFHRQIRVRAGAQIIREGDVTYGGLLIKTGRIQSHKEYTQHSCSA